MYVWDVYINFYTYRHIFKYITKRTNLSSLMSSFISSMPTLAFN